MPNVSNSLRPIASHETSSPPSEGWQGPETAPSNQSEANADRPLGIASALKKTLIELHNDEVTKSDPFAALSIGPRALELVLGERPGGGVTITHFSSIPQLHLAEAPLSLTLERLPSIEEKLGAALREYQVVEGVTPSRAALGVLGVVLRKINRDDRATCAAISEMCREARALDLNGVGKEGWSKSTELRIGGKAVVLEVTLVELSPVFRGLVGALKVDVPEVDRGNTHGFKVSLRLTHPTETEPLRRVKSFERQAVATTGLLAPLLGSEVALHVTSLPSTVASLFSGNDLLSSAVHNGFHITCLIAAGILSFSVYTKLNSLRKN